MRRMSHHERERLAKAYTATRYVIRPHPSTGGVEQILRAGALHPALDATLAARGHREWAFLTAWNPGSQWRSEEENRRAQERLEAQLVAGGWVVAPALGQAEDGGWCEPSLFVPGLPREEAARFGRAYGQVAVLVGRASAHAELLFCEEAHAPAP
ncbi:hypothetical protein MYMAC_006143 [Corallococcus macrosporus DSM 14697]|uniref:DUF3293 domain-containing protein n=2 Tax=Corallococcus macrosporus TaxID=35 RepID=A0A250K411_9BACT|nr:hypothetical protein MYMAC_006143 [Corallococcus macrosporus DSM 14697]